MVYHTVSYDLVSSILVFNHIYNETDLLLTDMVWYIFYYSDQNSCEFQKCFKTFRKSA